MGLTETVALRDQAIVELNETIQLYEEEMQANSSEAQDPCGHHAVHSAVAAFWEDYACDTNVSRAGQLEGPQVNDPGDPTPNTEIDGLRNKASEQVDHATSNKAETTDSYDEVDPGADGSNPDAPVEADFSQATAMREALAAARAEIAAADDEPPPGPSAESMANVEAPDAYDPVHFTADLSEEPTNTSPAPEQTEDEVDKLDLDASVRSKLKMLRRLQPGKSINDLLTQLESEKGSNVAPKQKRRWFAKK